MRRLVIIFEAVRFTLSCMKAEEFAYLILFLALMGRLGLFFYLLILALLAILIIGG